MTETKTVDFAATEPETAAERRFLRITSIAAAPAVGLTVAGLQALTMTNSGLDVNITFTTGIAFIIGTVAALAFWKIAVGWLGVRRERAVVIATIVVGLGAYLYPVRFMPRDKLPDIGIGVGCALGVIGFGVYTFWRFMRFMDADNKKVEAAQRKERHLP